MSITLQNILNLDGGTHFSNDEFADGEDPIKSKFRENCFYIVSAVLLQEDKVLLISETKYDGKWYLPAGKVKNQESLKVRLIILLCSTKLTVVKVKS